MTADKEALARQAMREILSDTSSDVLDDLYESDLDMMVGILDQVQTKAIGHLTDLDAFQREVKERMAEAGYVVKVRWYKGTYEGDSQVYDCPAIEVVSLTEKRGEFDHDRMAYEVQHDVLGIDGFKGKISESGIIKDV
jgi:hypothetical protein